MSVLSQFIPSGFFIKATTSYTSAQTVTWTKSGGTTGDTVVAVVVGGGGGGGRAALVTGGKGGNTYDYSMASGGGGGGVSAIGMPYDDCPSTVSVVVGAGGASRSTSGNGNSGANSSFGNFAIATGGQGGLVSSSGGISARGGSSLVGTSSNNANETAWNDGQRSTGGDSRYVQSSALNTTFGIPAGLTGGGGTVSTNVTTLYQANQPARTGTIFGAGGNGNSTFASNASAGSNPGGGGGGCISSLGGGYASGAGGTGAVYIYVVRGFASASDFLLRSSGNNYTVFM